MSAPQTTLAAAITTTVATTATVNDVLGFASSSETDDLVLVDSEFMLVAGGLGTTSWSSITRGYAGSTAATHDSGATVTRIARGWTNLVRAKRALGMTAADTDDDELLLDYIDAINAEFDQRVGVALYPSSDTVRIYDGRDAVNGGTRLWIPGGIRTLTQVRIAESSGGTLVTATLSDFLLRPHAHEVRPGMPYLYVEIKPDPDGSYRTFPRYLSNVELTGTFGPSAVQGNHAALADMVLVRMFNERDAGARSLPTPSKFIFPDDAAMLAQLRAEHFGGWR